MPQFLRRDLVSCPAPPPSPPLCVSQRTAERCAVILLLRLFLAALTLLNINRIPP